MGWGSHNANPLARLAQAISGAVGADLIGWLASGAGATPTTVNSALANLPELPALAFDSSIDTAGGSNVSAKIQNVVNAANGSPIALPAGVLRFDDPVFLTPAAVASLGSATAFLTALQVRGEGAARTIIDNRVADGPVFRLIGNASPVGYTIMPRVSDLTIAYLGGGAAPVNSNGIEINGAWSPRIERVWVTGITGDAISIEQSVGVESDQSVRFLIDECVFLLNDGHGLFSTSTGVGQIATAYFEVLRSLIDRNAAGGIYLANAYQTDIRQTAIVTNGAAGGGGGVTVRRNAVFNQFLTVEKCEIGNGNTPYNIWAEGVLEFETRKNRYVGNAGEAVPTDCIKVGSATYPCHYFRSDRDRFRFDATLSPMTAINVQGAAKGVEILDPEFQTFGAAGQVRYAIDASATGVRIREAGRDILGAEAEICAAVADAGAYTVDLSQGPIQRVTVTTVGALAVTEPAGYAAEGRRFTLVIVNGTPTPFTPTFSAPFRVSGVPEIASNARTSVDFFYDPFTAAWVQAGGWA